MLHAPLILRWFLKERIVTGLVLLQMKLAIKRHTKLVDVSYLSYDFACVQCIGLTFEGTLFVDSWVSYSVRWQGVVLYIYGRYVRSRLCLDIHCQTRCTISTIRKHGRWACWTFIAGFNMFETPQTELSDLSCDHGLNNGDGQWPKFVPTHGRGQRSTIFTIVLTKYVSIYFPLRR